MRAPLALAGSIILLTGASSFAQTASHATSLVETVDVSMVLVPVVVRDSAGRPVVDLTRDDFTITEDGIAQPIASFVRESGPVSVILTLDTSPSMQPHEMAMKRSALDFIRRQRDGAAFALAVFNDGVFLESDFTLDLRASQDAVAAARTAGENTALYDAITAASKHLERREGGRVAVVFTDGSDTVYPQDQEEAKLTSVIEMAHRRDVSIYTVAFGPRAAAGVLKRISDETGGEAFPALTAKDLPSAFAGVAEAVGQRYLLAYRLPAASRLHGAGGSGTNEFRRIAVKVARPGLRVAARTGYYAR